ncbi:T9SS type A sorting domain-containing protein [Epilithonimonas sp.]|uniref:T9SS type A sorting domain-containing protein n=1 Tax=Epilithonimonas sp. TaxID=2894511 RepID=UPI0028A1369D|nr:T9SS type A sorting domain-containing protein [Epilithonimonas sp.]
MKKNLIFLMMMSGVMSFSQNCNYGVASDGIANGENISTGGNFEYTSASDFDIEFGKMLTVNNVKFNVLKGTADLSYVNIYFYADNAGKPGGLIRSFENIVPTSQTFKYTFEDNSAYEINVDLPTTFDLPKGKYYLSVQGKPGDSTPASWEINKQETTKLGRFDFSKFDSEDWFGGFAYYDHVFQVSGICSATGETQPDYGTPSSQGNAGNNHETGGSMPGRSLADDIIVPDNTKFTLTNFKISTLQLGNIKNATINIRASVDDAPGEVLYSFENIGPKTENYFGYWPVPGYPLDVVAVDLDFELPQAVELSSGKYFIEVRATPVLFTDYLRWEATSHSGIGSDSYTSYDDGETWESNEGYNFVFDAIGFSKSSLAVSDFNKNNFRFYPNPVKDELTIVSENEVSRISIFNVAGQLVKDVEFKNNKADVSDLNTGIYIGKITLKNGQTQTIKVIKK